MGKFLVRLSNEFSSISGAASRSRAGISIPVGEGVTADLDKDQLKELHDDPYVTIHDPKTGELVTAKDEAVEPSSTEAENAQAAEEAPSTPEEMKEEVEKGTGTPAEQTKAVPAKKGK